MQGKNTRENKLIAAFGALTAFAFCLYGVLYWSAWRQSRPRLRIRRVLATPEHMARALQRTKALREKWKPWVTAHRKELAALRAATASDEVALQAARDALPPAFGQKPMQGFSSRELNAGVPFAFCLGNAQFLHLPEVQKDPVAYQHAVKGMDFERGLIRHNYENYRDIAYLQTMGTGAVGYTLWASGRITESSTNINKRDRRNLYSQRTEKEIVPAL